MTMNTVVTDGGGLSFLIEKSRGLFVGHHHKRAIEEPEGQRNVQSDEKEKKDVAFFHSLYMSAMLNQV